jgi:hypothetical protein
MGNGGHPVTIVVDVANVMGSRPDGWWRDRAGAAVRLHDQIARLAASGRASLPGAAGQAGEAGPDGRPGFVMVLEGAALAAADRLAPAKADQAGPGEGPGESTVAPGEVRVVRARGSGDDAVVALARELSGRRVVVTADRELRERSVAAGAETAGPGWLLGQLDP